MKDDKSMKMNEDFCCICGLEPNRQAIHRSSKNNSAGMYCWSCWHNHARKSQLDEFGIGIVGENTGKAGNHTLQFAIIEALEEIDLQDNIDLGVSIDSGIGDSYSPSLIVCNSHLYLCVAQLSDYFEARNDRGKQLRIINDIVMQLDFKLLEHSETMDVLE